MATWILVRSGASTGRTTFGYPIVTAQPDGGTRSVIVSYTARHSEYVSDRYAVMPFDAMRPASSGYQGGAGSQFFDLPGDFKKALQHTNESTPSLIPMIIGVDERPQAFVSLSGTWGNDPVYLAYNARGKNPVMPDNAPNTLHFSSAPYYSQLYQLDTLLRQDMSKNTLSNRTKHLQPNSICCQGWQQYGDDVKTSNWGQIQPCLGHLGDAGSQPGARKIWKCNEAFLEPKKSVMEIMALA